jgi:hypothetical protein
VIRNIIVTNEESIFNWHLNMRQLKVKYPEVYEEYRENLLDLDYYAIFEIIPLGDNIEEITIKKEAVRIFLSDGTEQKICNTELMNLLGVTYCEGWSIFNDDQFVYVILTIAQHQKGALAIWDTKEKIWIFSCTEEDFCVEGIVYSKKNSLFIGISIWNSPFFGGGEYIFFINPEGSFKAAELEEILDVDQDFIVDDLTLPFLNSDSYYLCSCCHKSFVMKKGRAKKSFYFLNL